MFRSHAPSTKDNASRSGQMPMVNFRKAIDRLFGDLNGGFDDMLPATWAEPATDFTPKLDLEETDEKIVLSAELPGLTQKDVEVEINMDCLTIKGEKRSNREEKDKNRYFCERSYGSFERNIQLPSEINRDKIDASVKDGVLTVTIPKSPDARKNVKKIPIHH